MKDISSWVWTKVKLALNQKLCSNCYRPYSKSTVSCEIVPGLKAKNTVFNEDLEPPIEIKPVLNDRIVLRKSSVRSFEPVLYLSVNCNCGKSSHIMVPNDNNMA